MKKLIIITILFFGCILTSVACFWDDDTIAMERQQFPSVIELISGKFLRHSPDFYNWRIEDRKDKLIKFPDSLALYDDLAVSFSKIGAHKKAIETILKKDSIKPDQYKTYANLGTFYLHDGQLKKGVKFIKKAVAINSNAHFGREIYQQYLAEYMLSKREKGEISLPLDPTFPKNGLAYIGGMGKSNNFYNFLIKKHISKSVNNQDSNDAELPAEKLENAVIGIMGMMKFGNHKSPVLLEALGDLLLNTGDDSGARHLAARAYLKASYQVDKNQAKKIYKKKVENTIREQMIKEEEAGFTIKALEKLLKEEIKEGNEFYQNIKSDEIAWINSGKNPEQAFAEKYYEKPRLSKRVQHSDTSLGHGNDKYLNDTTIGKIVDFRPVTEQEKINNIEKETNEETGSVEGKLLEETSAIDKPDKKKQESFIFSQKNLIFILLALLLATAGLIFWYKKRA